MYTKRKVYKMSVLLYHRNNAGLSGDAQTSSGHQLSPDILLAWNILVVLHFAKCCQRVS